MEDTIKTEQPIVKKAKKTKPFSLKDIAMKIQVAGNADVKVIEAIEDNTSIAKKKIKFPCYVLNMILGGGVPEGKFIEIFGKKSTAKSTLSMLLVNEVVSQDGYVLVLDKEADSWDFPNRNLQLGLDPSKVDHVMMAHPITIANVFDSIHTFIEETIIKNSIRDAPVLIVWDSIAGTTTDKELQANLGEKNFKDHAAQITEGHRRLEALMAANSLKNIIFLWTNQARNPMTVTYGYQEPVTFGGDAPSFYSSIRLELTRLKQLAGKRGNTTYPVGVVIKVKTVKNKVFSPFQACNIRLFFTKGIDDAGTSFEWMEANGMIKKATAKEIKEGGKEPLKILIAENEYLYFDKGKSFKALYESSEGERIKAYIESQYHETLANITSVMAGDSDVIEENVEEEQPQHTKATVQKDIDELSDEIQLS